LRWDCSSSPRPCTPRRMIKRLFSPRHVTIDKGLGGEPHKLVEALGGPLGDIAHDEAALSRATALATGDRAATFSPLQVRQRSCASFLGFRSDWIDMWALVEAGTLRVYADAHATAPTYTFQVKECQCTVGERDACKEGSYCFRLQHAHGVATLCALNSKQLILWLQALQAGGVRYEEPPIDMSGISSVFELSAEMLSGERMDMSRHAGCVCLVVNVASK